MISVMSVLTIIFWRFLSTSAVCAGGFGFCSVWKDPGACCAKSTSTLFFGEVTARLWDAVRMAISIGDVGNAAGREVRGGVDVASTEPEFEATSTCVACPLRGGAG